MENPWKEIHVVDFSGSCSKFGVDVTSHKRFPCIVTYDNAFNDKDDCGKTHRAVLLIRAEETARGVLWQKWIVLLPIPEGENIVAVHVAKILRRNFVVCLSMGHIVFWELRDDFLSSLAAEEWITVSTDECSILKLDYVPVGVFTDCVYANEIVCLVTDTEGAAHLFSVLLEGDKYEVSSINTGKYFPPLVQVEKSSLSSPVVSLDGKRDTQLGMDAVCCGCLNGYLFLSTRTAKGIENSEMFLDGAITGVAMFAQDERPGVEFTLENLIAGMDGQLSLKGPLEKRLYHLVVVSALGYAVLFTDIVCNGLKCHSMVPFPDDVAALTGLAICDLRGNGQPSIFISGGNTVYCFRTRPGTLCELDYCWKKQFTTRILTTILCDVTGDGLTDLCVLGKQNLYIMQTNLKTESERILGALESLLPVT